jgi:hypothetical protein
MESISVSANLPTLCEIEFFQGRFEFSFTKVQIIYVREAQQLLIYLMTNYEVITNYY